MCVLRFKSNSAKMQNDRVHLLCTRLQILIAPIDERHQIGIAQACRVPCLTCNVCGFRPATDIRICIDKAQEYVDILHLGHTSGPAGKNERLFRSTLSA